MRLLLLNLSIAFTLLPVFFGIKTTCAAIVKTEDGIMGFVDPKTIAASAYLQILKDESTDKGYITLPPGMGLNAVQLRRLNDFVKNPKRKEPLSTLPDFGDLIALAQLCHDLGITPYTNCTENMIDQSLADHLIAEPNKTVVLEEQLKGYPLIENKLIEAITKLRFYLNSKHSGSPVYKTLISPDNSKIITLSDLPFATVWDITSKEPTRITFLDHKEKINDGCFNHSGTRIALITANQVTIGDAATYEKLWSIKNRKVNPDLDFFKTVVFSPNDQEFTLVTHEGSAKRFDAQTYQELPYTLPNSEQIGYHPRYPYPPYMAITTDLKSAVIYNTATHAVLSSIKTQQPIENFCFFDELYLAILCTRSIQLHKIANKDDITNEQVKEVHLPSSWENPNFPKTIRVSSTNSSILELTGREILYYLTDQDRFLEPLKLPQTLYWQFLDLSKFPPGKVFTLEEFQEVYPQNFALSQDGRVAVVSHYDGFQVWDKKLRTPVTSITQALRLVLE